MKNIYLRMVLQLVLSGTAWEQEIVDQFLMNGNFQLPVKPGGPLWGVLTAPFSQADWATFSEIRLPFCLLAIWY